MVWFSAEVIRPKMIFSQYLQRLKQDDYDKPPKINLENERKTIKEIGRCGSYSSNSQTAKQMVSRLLRLDQLAIIR
jgi:hypothetical protein